MDKMVVDVKCDLIDTFLHHKDHPAEPFISRLSGFLFLIICKGDFKANY